MAHYFSSLQFTKEDLSEIMYFFEQGITVFNKSDKSTATSFAVCSPETKQAIASLINTLNTKLGKGLLYPHIDSDDLTRLLTTGNCHKQYVCRNQTQFAFIIHYLAHIGIIPKTCYYKTCCQFNKLLRPCEPTSECGKQYRTITASGLAKAYDQIANHKSELYTSIKERILLAVTSQSL